MNKVILKTAIFTVLALIVATILTIVGVFAFAPKFAGNCCYELGLKGLAVDCYERVYMETGEFEDLVELVNCGVYAQDDTIVSNYGEEMIGRKVEFKNFCDNADVDVEFTDGAYTTYDYYVNAIMLAKYALNEKQEAVDFVFRTLFVNGYTENSALKMLVNMVSSEEGLGDLLVEGYMNLEPGSRYGFTNHQTFRDEMKELGYTIS